MLGGIAVFVATVLGTAGVATAGADKPPGNNGTVKIGGNPIDDGPNNEPHVNRKVVWVSGCTAPQVAAISTAKELKSVKAQKPAKEQTTADPPAVAPAVAAAPAAKAAVAQVLGESVSRAAPAAPAVAPTG